MPLYTPLGGSWLNRAESLQRIIVRQALSGQHPPTSEQIIEWLEQTVKGWNQQPTPFIWNGKRRRRARSRRLGGSGAAILVQTNCRMTETFATPGGYFAALRTSTVC